MGLFMPANIIHLVETVGEAVVVGANFLHRDHLPSIADAIRDEIADGINSVLCYTRSRANTYIALNGTVPS